ncbi:MAG: Hsp20/alpha crystallin family protein [Nitrospinae bacterium]|nr:Hsp20/alpha crystallin family protein [Nitrospinota bacterium]
MSQAGLVRQDMVSVKTDMLGETFFVQMDLYETADEVVVEMDLPGMNVADIKVTNQGDNLLVEGVKKEFNEACDKLNYLCMERIFGPVRRILQLPAPINPASISAIYRNGVLIIRAPKLSERRSRVRQISIQGE